MNSWDDELVVAMSNTIPAGQPITIYFRDNTTTALYDGDLIVEFSSDG